CRGQVLYGRSGRPARLIGITSDISDRTRAEQQRLRLEGKLLEARRLESIGRLAGGVAHDFNNLLAIIKGYTAFLTEALTSKDPLKTYALEVANAADRAVDVVGQLLSFSQQQTIRPAILDLNELIRAEEAALRRRLGEKCALVLLLAPDLGRVRADADQL